MHPPQAPQLRDFTRERFIELDRLARRSVAANRVALIVGFVLGPLLFGGIGLFLWAKIPEPFGTAVGGSIVGAGGIFVLFLLWYARRTMTRPPFVAAATLLRSIEQAGRYGDRAYAVEVDIAEARALSDAGYGDPVPKIRGRKRLRVGRRLHGIVPTGSQVLLICMPTQEVVAMLVGDTLTTA